MLGQPISMLLPQVVGFRLDRRAARGLDRHRPRAHRDPDAARARRGRQVRGVLRPGPRDAAAGRPRHDRQHGARVRRHLRHLPGRRRDAPLPRVLGPPGRAGGAGRGLLPRAGPVPRRELGGRRLLRHARARPGRRRAEPGRPAAPAGPRGARRRRRATSRRSWPSCSAAATSRSSPPSRRRRSPSPPATRPSPAGDGPAQPRPATSTRAPPWSSASAPTGSTTAPW